MNRFYIKNIRRFYTFVILFIISVTLNVIMAGTIIGLAVTSAAIPTTTPESTITPTVSPEQTFAPISESTVMPEPTIEPSFEMLTASTHEQQFIKLEGEFLLTAYCACKKCCYEWANKRPIDDSGEEIVYTSTGAIAKVERTVAVDPEVIPYGTILLINGHYYVAEDCSDNWVHGNHIDIYMGNHEEAHQEAINFGEQYAEVYIYNTLELPSSN